MYLKCMIKLAQALLFIYEIFLVKLEKIVSI